VFVAGLSKSCLKSIVTPARHTTTPGYAKATAWATKCGTATSCRLATWHNYLTIRMLRYLPTVSSNLLVEVAVVPNAASG